MSSSGWPQSAAYERLPRPQSAHGPNMRLPGVRQLLLPDPFVASDPSTLTPRHLLEPPCPISSTTALKCLDDWVSLPECASEGSIRGLQSDSSESATQKPHSMRTSSSEASIPMHHQTPTFMQTSPQHYAQVSPLEENLFSSWSYQSDLARASSYGYQSPGNSPATATMNYRAIGGQHSQSYNSDAHARGTISAKPWHEAITHPDWGITKAGKPRKRLAQACINCRQKKIRCHPNPNLMKCAQCERTQAECRFESGSRDAPSNRTRQREPPQHSVVGPDLMETCSNYAGSSNQSELQNQSMSLVITADEHNPITYPASSAVPDYGGKLMNQPQQGVVSGQDMSETIKTPPGRLRSTNAPSTMLDSPPILDTMEMLGLHAANWNLDPYTISPVTEEYLELYFTHVNQGTNYIFSKGPFLKWVRDCREKTLDDKMLLYAMVSMGCSYSTRKESVVHGKRMGKIARYAEQNSVGRFTLQLVQTRLVLSLLKFSLGDFSEASDYYGAAVRGVCELKLNTENDTVEGLDMHGCEYGLSKRTMAECRRRTFWSVYLMERCNGLCPGLPLVLQNEDCFLRLPCNEELYENQEIPVTPVFATIDQNFNWPKPASLGALSYLIAISSIWGQLWQYLCRKKHRTYQSDDDKYEEFYSGKQRQLRKFIGRLPRHFSPCSTQNIQQAFQEGYAETFILLHARYHTTLITLNRHALHTEMDDRSLSRNIRAAQFHAREVLKFTLLLSKVYEEQCSSIPARTYSAPFQAYSMLSAVDTLTSIGTLADLTSDLQLVQSGFEVLQELSKHWASAQRQLKMIAVRFEEIMKALECGSREDVFFVTADAMESMLGRDLDLFFAPPVEKRFAALGISRTVGDMSGVLTINSLDSGIGCCGIRTQP